MLLAIDASRANNEQKTGVEWYAYFVIQELKKIVPFDWQVILYTREPLKGDLAILPSHWQEKVLKWPPRRLWTQLRLSWEIWRMKHVTCNIKHETKEKIILFVPAHVLPLVCSKKVVTTIHDLGGLRFPAGYSWFEKWYARFATRFALQRAVVLTPSKFVKGEIEYLFARGESLPTGQAGALGGVSRSKYLERCQIQVIPNGYDASLFKMIDNPEMIQAVLRKYNIHQPYFLSISRLEEKKNTVGIIEAFENFKSRALNSFPPKADPPRAENIKFVKISNIQYLISKYSLVLLGKHGYGYGRVKKVLESSQYKNDIILPGWVETADVPYLMAGATAFVFPSFYEGFGIPVLEAMAVGTPVIASDRAALPEVCQDAAILINPYKSAQIADAMKQLVFSPELRQELIKRGLEGVKKYSWEKTAGEIWRILCSI